MLILNLIYKFNKMQITDNHLFKNKICYFNLKNKNHETTYYLWYYRRSNS